MASACSNKSYKAEAAGARFIISKGAQELARAPVPEPDVAAQVPAGDDAGLRVDGEGGDLGAVPGQGGDPHIDDSLPQPEVFDVSDCATQYQIVDAEESGNNASISETPLVDLKLVGFSISEGPEGTCLVEAVFRAVN